MKEKKIITVFGATGSQGGGLARAILQDTEGEFTIRAVTRDAQSDKVKELESMGAEIVVADIDDIESVKQAMHGAYGAYCVTFFWAHFSPEKEMSHAQNFAQAAKEEGITHLIWSTLEDTRILVPLSDNRMPTLGEKYKVPHFDAKGESDHFFIDQGVPTTFLLTTFYWDNLVYSGMGPKRGEDGKLVIAFPMGKSPLLGIAAEDIGKCAFGIFKKGTGMIGKRVGIAGDNPTGDEMANTLSKVLGEEVVYHAISPETYRNLGFPGAEDLGNMFQYYNEFAKEFAAARDIGFAKELNPELKSFEMWAKENAKKIPLA